MEGPQAIRAVDRLVANPLGPRSTGLAPGVLGNGRQVPRRRVRHPRRRHRPALPAPRERAGPVRSRREAVRSLLDAQRVGDRGRGEDEQVAGQRRAGLGGDQALTHREPSASTWSAPHYRSAIEFSERLVGRGHRGPCPDRQLRRSGRGRRRRRPGHRAGRRSSTRWTTTWVRRRRLPCSMRRSARAT